MTDNSLPVSRPTGITGTVPVARLRAAALALLANFAAMRKLTQKNGYVKRGDANILT